MEWDQLEPWEKQQELEKETAAASEEHQQRDNLREEEARHRTRVEEFWKSEKGKQIELDAEEHRAKNAKLWDEAKRIDAKDEEKKTKGRRRIIVCPQQRAEHKSNI